MPVLSGAARSPRRAAAGIAAVAAFALLTGCAAEPSPAEPPAGGNAAPTGNPQSSGIPGEPQVIATGLEVPWAVSFLPDGDALVTERGTARILQVSPDGGVTPVGVVDGVRARGEGGLLGVAVSPDFATDRTVVVYYTAEDENRIVALTVAEDGTIDGADQRVLVDGIPSGRTHNGGGLRFGPDGHLWVGTGDAGNSDSSQDPGDLGGKILRITLDGEAAPDNPDGTPVYALGIRNSQGIDFGPDGTAYASEFGANLADELNRIEAGANYGWPELEGAESDHGEPVDERYTEPLLSWAPEEASPSGLAQAGGSLWMSSLRGERLWRIPLNDDGSVGEAEELLTDHGRIRGVTATPDGSAVWVTTSNRETGRNPDADDDRIIVLPLE
ncbi:PQQ-dependent sugar dehydrogenase [Pseudonocardia nematodicida]|uniref:PQQ-dependent sugar dehydrogenase n=1 Tax=Pseudonocardia nematodicida TaxID=1206997 RepID=A0ABV1KI37_9PSEU